MSEIKKRIQRPEEKLVTDQGMSMALLELHKPDRTVFYWQGTEEDRIQGKMVLRMYNDLFSWAGVVTIPAYTLGEIFQILPRRIEASHIAKEYPISYDPNRDDNLTEAE
jgi:hypothetical protein